MSERGRVRYPAVCSCFLPLIVHFIIAQAADLVLAQTAGAGSPDSAAGVSVLTSAVCIPLFALWLRSEEKFREEKAAGADRTAWICLAFVCGAALSLLWGGCSTFFRLSDFFSDNAQERLFSASLPLQILGPGLLAPVCEELLFRGLMFRIWTREFSRRSGILWKRAGALPVRQPATWRRTSRRSWQKASCDSFDRPSHAEWWKYRGIRKRFYTICSKFQAEHCGFFTV